MIVDNLNVYNTKVGNQLLNPDYFPYEVIRYLQMEKNLISTLVSNYDLLIEVGCFDAYYLPLVASMNKRYLGIDICERNIIEAKHRAEFWQIKDNVYELMLLDAHDIHTIASESRLIRNNSSCRKIIVLPFNIIGNIFNIDLFLVSLNNLGYDLILSSFMTNEHATYWRKIYYSNCCSGVTLVAEDYGNRFISQDGLNSISYNLDWLTSKFKREGFINHFFHFDNIGIALFSQRI